jgi:hypothetical protein
METRRTRRRRGRSRHRGGYTPTARNVEYVRRFRRGEPIGFTMRASLKAKGLIPRESRKFRGKRVISEKYL